jgi:hypothetical protein
MSQPFFAVPRSARLLPEHPLLVTSGSRTGETVGGGLTVRIA